MTPELSAALVDVTRRSVDKMKREEHSNLQDLRDRQREGQVSEDEFAKSKRAKLGHIDTINQARRELLEAALLDQKHQQSEGLSQGSNGRSTSQQMVAVLAALNDVSQRLAKLESSR